MKMKNYNSVAVDAGMGLVLRLNWLFTQIDQAAEAGKYDKWNNILDRVWTNLSFKIRMETKVDKDGKIISIDYHKQDIKEYNFLSQKIEREKNNWAMATRQGKVNTSKMIRKRWYHAVQQKDIWLRVLMHKLKLYLKEFERAPGTAAFGGLGQ